MLFHSFDYITKKMAFQPIGQYVKFTIKQADHVRTHDHSLALQAGHEYFIQMKKSNYGAIPISIENTTITFNLPDLEMDQQGVFCSVFVGYSNGARNPLKVHYSLKRTSLLLKSSNVAGHFVSTNQSWKRRFHQLKPTAKWAKPFCTVSYLDDSFIMMIKNLSRVKPDCSELIQFSGNPRHDGRLLGNPQNDGQNNYSLSAPENNSRYDEHNNGNNSENDNNLMRNAQIINEDRFSTDSLMLQHNYSNLPSINNASMFDFHSILM